MTTHSEREEMPASLMGIEVIRADGSPYLKVHFGMITVEYDRTLRMDGK